MGRKSKLTPEVQEEICKGVRIGLTYKDAAALAGISESAFYHWLTRGEKAKSGIYKEFLEALHKANADAKAVLVGTLSRLARGGIQQIEKTYILDANGNRKEVKETDKKTLPDRQAAQFILERRYPEEWGRHDNAKVELSGSVETSPIFVTNMRDEDLLNIDDMELLPADEVEDE